MLLGANAIAQQVYRFDSLTQTQIWTFRNGAKPDEVYQWRDTGSAQDRHVTKYWWNGNKREEYSQRYAMKYDTSWHWDSDGFLTHLDVYSSAGYISIDYHDSSNRIRQRGEYKLLGKIQPPILIEDTVNEIKYNSKPCDYGCYAPIGTWHTFHSNGQLESSGNYLPIQFESEQVYQDTLVYESPCYPPGTFVLIVLEGDVLLRDGQWAFYDEFGKKIREEYYEGGLLRKTIYH